jgi:6-phosphogluconolactonase
MKTTIRNLLLCFLLSIVFSTSSHAQGNFVYVNNSTFPGANTVSAFSIGPNGSLSAVPGSPFLTGAIGANGGFFGVNRATVSTVGGFLFVTNDAPANVSAFSINPLTGVLTLVPGSPFATAGMRNLSISATPDGRFLVAASTDSLNITVFSIAGNGALTPVPGSPFPAAGGPVGIKVAPNGKFVAAGLVGPNAVAMFSIASNGSLSPVPGSPFAVSGPGSAIGVDINCESNRLFVAEGELGVTVVDAFSIAGNGALTPVPGSPFVVNSSSFASIVLVSPNDRFLFVSNTLGQLITVFSIAANGALTQVPGSPFSNGGDLSCFHLGIATNQPGTLLYSVDGCGKVYGFSIAANGALTLVPGSPFTATSGAALAGVAVYPAKSCGAGAFDLCIQDDSSGSTLKINSTTGDYLFTSCSGATVGGRGTITKRGSTITLQHFGIDRRVLSKYDGAVKRATASVQIIPPGVTSTIVDRNTADNSCSCN